MLRLVSPAAPNPAPPSGTLPKCTTPASRPAASTRYHQFALRDGHDRPCLATKTLGNVALYRHWIIDPDGKEILRDGRNRATIDSFRLVRGSPGIALWPALPS